MSATTYVTDLDAIAAGNALSYATQPKRRRPYLAKEVSITAEHYERAHGRAPRGYGVWMFAPAHVANEQTETGEPITPNEARQQIHNTARAYRGTYAQARAQAARDAAATATTRHEVTLAILP